MVHELRAGGCLHRPANCPVEIYQLQKQCWFHDATLRPSFADVFARLLRFQSTTTRGATSLSIGLQDISVDSDKLTFVRDLARGSFCDTCLCSLARESGQVDAVVVKTLREGIANTASKSAFVQQLFLAETLVHPNIVRLVAVCTMSQLPRAVFKYEGTETLSEYTAKNKFEDIDLAKLALDVARGLEYLSQRRGFMLYFVVSIVCLGIVLRGIAAHKCLVNDDKRVKLTAFHSRALVNTDVHSTSLILADTMLQYYRSQLTDHQPFNKKRTMMR